MERGDGFFFRGLRERLIHLEEQIMCFNDLITSIRGRTWNVFAKILPFPFLFLLLWFCMTWCLEPSSAWHHGIMVVLYAHEL